MTSSSNPLDAKVDMSDALKARDAKDVEDAVRAQQPAAEVTDPFVA